jgi:glycosyltransferase involved in cell wall biosynthesis
VKGFDRLLKAWAIVEKQQPDWTLAIYGDGDNSSYVKLRDELCIDASRCQLHGATSNIQEEYRASSIYVLTSRFEGLSMAMLEAISCGLPLVAFACPCGPRDVVEDGVNGFLVENGDVEKLAERMIEVMQSPERLRQMGKAAQEKSKEYQIEKLALRWKQLFENICNIK